MCFRSITVNSTTIENTNEDTLKPWQEIPGPSSLPLIGQLHHFLPGGKPNIKIICSSSKCLFKLLVYSVT